MYTFCIVMICIASILLILAVLVQSPKSCMAANFGAANQTMGVRQTTDFLEKFTWAMVAAIVFFSILSTVGLEKSESVGAGSLSDEIKSEYAEAEAAAAEAEELATVESQAVLGEGVEAAPAVVDTPVVDAPMDVITVDEPVEEPVEEPIE
jgi:preprotein translocase subunit SecG